MNIRILLGAFFALFFITGCDKNIPVGNGTTMNPGGKTEQKLSNIAYGTDSAYKMDVYLPKNRNISTPVVILLHGSYWVGGDKKDMNVWQDSFLNNGIATVNINFRLADTFKIHSDSIMADIKRAVDNIVLNSTKWNIKSSGYIMAGMNSGGHLALLYSYKYNYGNKVKGVMALAAPADLTDDTYLNGLVSTGKIEYLEAITGAKYTAGTSVPVAFWEASPRFYPKNIPTLLIHGLADDVVSYAQPNVLHGILDANNYYNRLVPVPAVSHDLSLGNATIAGNIFHEMKSWCLQFGS